VESISISVYPSFIYLSIYLREYKCGTVWGDNWERGEGKEMMMGVLMSYRCLCIKIA
jgi:hypothetical protein